MRVQDVTDFNYTVQDIENMLADKNETEKEFIVDNGRLLVIY